MYKFILIYNTQLKIKKRNKNLLKKQRRPLSVKLTFRMNAIYLSNLANTVANLVLFYYLFQLVLLKRMSYSPNQHELSILRASNSAVP